MRRILSLHALLGTGHLSAARALEAAFQRFPEGRHSVFVDSLGLASLDQWGAAPRTSAECSHCAMPLEPTCAVIMLRC